MNVLFLSILGLLYLLFGFFISFYKKDKKSLLSIMKLEMVPLIFSLVIPQIGAGIILGSGVLGYKIGYFGILYGLGLSLGLFILGFGFASRVRALNIITIGQLFEKKYNSLFLSKIASLISIVTLFGVLGAQIVALRSVLSILNVNSSFVLVIFWLLIITYTVMSGFKPFSLIDTIKVLFLIILFVVLFIVTLFNEPGSFFSFSSLVGRQSLFQHSGLGFLTIFPILFNPMLFALIEPRFMWVLSSAKNKQITNKAAVYAGLAVLGFAFIPVFFGMQAKFFNLYIYNGINPLLLLINLITNNILFTFLVIALLLVLISISSFLLSIITLNIYHDFKISHFKAKRLYISKIIGALIGVFALIIACFSNDIIGILIQSYEFSISCLFVSVVVSFFKKYLNKNAAILSILFGFVAFVFFRLFSFPVPKELISLAVSLAGYVIGDKFFKVN